MCEQWPAEPPPQHAYLLLFRRVRMMLVILNLRHKTVRPGALFAGTLASRSAIHTHCVNRILASFAKRGFFCFLKETLRASLSIEKAPSSRPSSAPSRSRSASCVLFVGFGSTSCPAAPRAALRSAALHAEADAMRAGDDLERASDRAGETVAPVPRTICSRCESFLGRLH